MKQQEMGKIKVSIQFHSIVGLITNSSSEIFCSIEIPKELLEQVRNRLSEILDRKVHIDDDDYGESNFISFSIDYGDNKQITDDFKRLLTYVLEKEFGSELIKIDYDPEN